MKASLRRWADKSGLWSWCIVRLHYRVSYRYRSWFTEEVMRLKWPHVCGEGAEFEWHGWGRNADG